MKGGVFMSLVSWIALIIVILLVAGAVFVVVNDKKNGKNSCGMGCAGCSACSGGCSSCGSDCKEQDKAEKHNA